MRNHATRTIAVVSLMLVAASCQCGGPGGSGKRCTKDSDCNLATEACVNSVCTATSLGDGGFVGGDGGVVDSDVVSIEIAPRDVTLTTSIGMPVGQDFTATLKKKDGSTVPVSTMALWSVNVRSLGDIRPDTGRFLAAGTQAGKVDVSVTVTTRAGQVLSDKTSLTVTLKSVTAGTGVPVDIDTTFPMTTPGSATQAASLVYPLNKALMPQNVFPADIQWLNGGPGDIFRITLKKSNITVVHYQKATDDKNHFLPEKAQWNPFAQSNPDEDGVITVDRWVSGMATAYSGEPVTVKFARAALSGSVYYWAVGVGRIRRIDDGTNQGVAFMDTLPGNAGCIGCHTVSPSGRYMSNVLSGGDGPGTVVDLTKNLAMNPVTEYPVGPTRFQFSTWSPDEKRIMANRGRNLVLINPTTGQDVPVMGTALPKDGSVQPNWAPDGTTIAFISGSSDWGVDYQGGDISVLPVTGTDTFGAASVLVPNASAVTNPRLKTLTYPQWTPDSKRIVFGHSVNGRAQQQGRLEIVARDGTGVAAMDTASLTGKELSAYEPRMSPFDSGGYHWVAFLSRRPYGNSKVGNRRGNDDLQDVPQIWVTAVKKSASAGEDPSAVGYWLPGQDPRSASISAYWAAKACRATGADCSVNSECCSEECRPPSGGGAPVCSPPPPDRCRMEGQTCGGAGDCCAGFECKVNVCTKVDDGIN
jgi:WD40-like Beta Propeller Repeat